MMAIIITSAVLSVVLIIVVISSVRKSAKIEVHQSEQFSNLKTADHSYDDLVKVINKSDKLYQTCAIPSIKEVASRLESDQIAELLNEYNTSFITQGFTSFHKKSRGSLEKVIDPSDITSLANHLIKQCPNAKKHINRALQLRKGETPYAELISFWNNLFVLKTKAKVKSELVKYAQYSLDSIIVGGKSIKQKANVHTKHTFGISNNTRTQNIDLALITAGSLGAYGAAYFATDMDEIMYAAVEGGDIASTVADQAGESMDLITGASLGLLGSIIESYRQYTLVEKGMASVGEAIINSISTTAARGAGSYACFSIGLALGGPVGGVVGSLVGLLGVNKLISNRRIKAFNRAKDDWKQTMKESYEQVKKASRTYFNAYKRTVRSQNKILKEHKLTYSIDIKDQVAMNSIGKALGEDIATLNAYIQSSKNDIEKEVLKNVYDEHMHLVAALSQSDKLNIKDVKLETVIKNGSVEKELKRMVDEKSSHRQGVLVGFLAWMDMTMHIKQETVRSIVQKMQDHKEKYNEVVSSCDRDINAALNILGNKRAQIR